MADDTSKLYKKVNLSAYKWEADNTNDKNNPGTTIAVNPDVIPVGSIVSVNGQKYTAVAKAYPDLRDAAGDTVNIQLPVSSYSEVFKTGTKAVDIVVYPPETNPGDGSTDSLKSVNNAETGELKSDTSVSTFRQLDEASQAAVPVTTTGTPVTGAGTDAAMTEENGILTFASFAQSLAFKQHLQQGFQRGGELTLHEFIIQFMTKFYHQLYYIPNLRNNYTIVVKPETLFVNAPSCNLIFPVIKSQISYTRSYKQEPTRLLQMSDPFAAMGGAASSTPTQLICMMFTEWQESGKLKNGLPIHNTYVTSFGEHESLTDKAHPMLNLTEYEKVNGIRCSTVNKGADLYLFLKSQGTQEVNTTNGGRSDEEYVITIDNSDANMSGIGTTIGKLARYELIRQRYVGRVGSVDMYFNPYIVPGFPFVSIETSENGLNIYGYVTSVVHSLTDRSWTTNVSFNCAHMDHEQSPAAYPIVESEYASKLPETYADMLGSNVIPITNEAIPELISTYGNDKVYVSTAYKKIWRETPSLEDYLSGVADGATLVEDNNFWWIANPSGSTFFDTTIQERIKEYTNNIINNKLAMSVDDVV